MVRTLKVVVALVVTWLLLAYLILPALWRHYEHQPALESAPKMGPIPTFEPFSIMSTGPPSELRGGRSIAARCRTPPGTLQETRSPIAPRIGCDKAGHGRTGQAFGLGESGVVDKATANSSLWTTAGHKQGDQAAKTKPPAGSCSRILDQSLGPTRARTSRNRPLE